MRLRITKKSKKEEGRDRKKIVAISQRTIGNDLSRCDIHRKRVSSRCRSFRRRSIDRSEPLAFSLSDIGRGESKQRHNFERQATQSLSRARDHRKPSFSLSLFHSVFSLCATQLKGSPRKTQRAAENSFTVLSSIATMALFFAYAVSLCRALPRVSARCRKRALACARTSHA